MERINRFKIYTLSTFFNRKDFIELSPQKKLGQKSNRFEVLHHSNESALFYIDLIAIAPYDGILKKHETQVPCLGWILHRNQDKKRAIPIDLGDCSFIT